jgi:hypothetical protein
VRWQNLACYDETPGSTQSLQRSTCFSTFNQDTTVHPAARLASPHALCSAKTMSGRSDGTAGVAEGLVATLQT